MSISFSGVNSQKQNAPKQPKFRNKGFFAAQYATSAITAPLGFVSPLLIKGMRKVSKLSEQESSMLSNAVQKGLDVSGLAKKGVQVHTMEEMALPSIKDVFGLLKKVPETVDDVFDTVIEKFDIFGKFSEADKPALDVIKKEMESNKLLKFIKKVMPQPKKAVEGIEEFRGALEDMSAKQTGSMFKFGLNAAFFPNVNAIITPSKSLRTSVFHEMGHALNFNGGGVLKALQKFRPAAMIIPSLVMTAALLNKRKTTDEKLENNSVKNVVQNGLDGIKKHAGLISAAAMLPVVLEEGIASLRGQALAKNLVKSGELTQEIFKKVKLTNLGGFASYALAMVAAGVGAKLTIDIKDKIQEKYEQKKLAKFEEKQAKQAAKANK
ncbi:hypothetical protein II906_07770 [bacterium]|nr:hypothetical protein [bacterium]